MNNKNHNIGVISEQTECRTEICRPNRTWIEVMRKDCQARKLSREDAMDREIDKGWLISRKGVSG